MKSIIKVMLILILSLTFIGCSKTNDSDKNNTEATNSSVKDKKEVTLTFAIWDILQKEGMVNLVNKFNEYYPNININVEVTPWSEYWTKMEAAGTSGKLPDVFWMHTNEFLRYASNDMLLDLTNLENTDNYADFPENLLSLATYDNKIYGVPKDYDIIVLAYNKDLFDKAGLAYPDETWDWAKLEETAKKLTDKENGQYGLALTLLDQQEAYLPLISQAGGYVIKDGKSGYDNPNTIEGLEEFIKLYKNYSPTLAQFSDTNRDLFFTSGKIGMMFLGSWRINDYSKNTDINDKFDLAVLPKGKMNATIINGLSFAGAKNTEYPEEVKLFLSFLASEEAQLLQASDGTAISARGNTGEAWLKNYPNYNVKVIMDMVSSAVPMPTSLTKASWLVKEQEMIKKMMLGDIDVTKGAKEIADFMNKELATE